jgi:hypothetical protein
VYVCVYVCRLLVRREGGDGDKLYKSQGRMVISVREFSNPFLNPLQLSALLTGGYNETYESEV